MTASQSDPTFLGRVIAVTGASVTVALTRSLASGLAIIGGQTYRVGQVGSFVRIPLGYQDLYGIVVEVGENLGSHEETPEINAARWMRVELAGESIGGQFQRGLSQHPNVNDNVHLVTEVDLKRIYGGSGDDQISIGTLSNSDNIVVRLSLDNLVTRHSAIIGSTGSGKSTTVASLIRSIVGSPSEGRSSPGARILLLDLHGEYASALGDIAKIFSATPAPKEEPLFIPFWALDANDLLELVAGGVNETQEIAFIDKMIELKVRRLQLKPMAGLDLNSLTVDSPTPFSLAQLWYEMIDFETMTFAGAQRDVAQLLSEGDPAKLVPPTYKPYAMGSAGPFQNPSAKGVKRQLNSLRSRLLDRRYDFILHPGDWEPDLKGFTHKDLDVLLAGWLGHERPVTIFDLSSVPSATLVRLIGSILRIIYEALYWSREKTEGGILRPLLIVMEEAHRYLSASGDASASEIIQRIAKEGRKYGVGAMLVSQRPTEIEETVLAQCGTMIALRLSNPADRAQVKGALPDNLSGLTDLLPVLRTGEAMIAGEAARMPVRCRIMPPLQKYLPRSVDPDVTEAWSIRRRAEGYDRVVASWRAQRTRAVANPVKIDRRSVPPEEA